MDFIARVFVETAATMVLLAVVNSADMPRIYVYLEDIAGVNSFELAAEAPPIPATYYQDVDSPMVSF